MSFAQIGRETNVSLNASFKRRGSGIVGKLQALAPKSWE